jgi:hypothetical protein
MKKLIFILWMVIPFWVNGQTINGFVFNTADKTPVQFANIGLMHLPDSTTETGVISLTDGSYSFEKIRPGKYFIKASYMGFNSNGTEINVGNQNLINADTIFLAQESKKLAEVTVVAERLQGKELVDRTVYTVPAEIAKTAANGYDLLKKIPQVQVDFQNNITMNGSSNFIIQVDGKQRDKEFLAKLQPSDIESIEIINNPSGKYEGNIDGVINIVLKKEARFGLSGSVSAILKPFNKPTAIASGSIDYGMGKISFYFTGFSFSQSLNISNSNYSRFLQKDSIVNMNGNGKFNVTNTSLNTGFDYYINDKNNLSFNINYKPVYQKSDLNNISDLNNAAKLIVYSIDKTLSDEGSASLFYKKTFKKAVQEFTIENTYYLFSSKVTKDYNNLMTNVTFDDTLSNSLFLEDNINDRSYYSLKVNYVQPIGLSVKLEGGYQYYYQKMKYDFSSSVSGNNNIFNYIENRNCAYVGFTANLKKLGIQSNVRIENSDNNINDSESSSYYCVLPSVNIQYKFTASQNAKITYNRRINRPGIYNLNPYQKINSNLSISEGNPDLKPEYRDRIQTTYSVNFGKNYCSPYLYYEKIKDKTGTLNLEYTTTDNKTTILSRPENMLTGEEMGGGINAMLWILNINARYYKGHFDKYTGNSAIETIEARDYSSYSINGYFFAQLPKNAKLTEFIFFNYNGVNINAQSKTYNTPFYGFGMQKEIGNHNIGFVYLLPFSKNIEFNKTITETSSLYNDTRTKIDISWYVQFMYTYKFNRGKNVKKLNRKSEIESDSKNDGFGK